MHAKMSDQRDRAEAENGERIAGAMLALAEAQALLDENEPEAPGPFGALVPSHVSIGDGRTAYTFPPFDALANALRAFVEA